MNKRLWSVFVGICGLLMLSLSAIPSAAQMSEVKEKPAMYSYVANWQIPRAQWAAMEKDNESNKPILDKAMADGTLVGYGNDENLVHEADGETHDNWWASMSMAGLIKVLDQFYASGGTSSPALNSATKHWDLIFMSKYYNWKPGPWKNGYVHVSSYKLKADAPNDAIEMISKHLVVPMLEKMLADGSIREYEVDTEAIHTGAPDNFWIVYVASSPEGLDKVSAAITDSLKDHPFAGPAFGAMTVSSAHRDELLRGEGTYK
ncbi:MAG TPA: hypothetical protein VK574_14290 [Terracidiphilus sp.]|jgi:hypothetical protein|nr:hypothetical protein [Terracidiphilus sp.]